MATEVLTAILVCVATVIVNAILSIVLNLPKKYKAQKEQEKKEQYEFNKKCLESFSKLNDKIDDKFNEVKEEIEILKASEQQSLRLQLNTEYKKAMSRGWASQYEKESLEKVYNAYHELGANGFMNSQREAFLKLPCSLEEKKQNKD